MRAKDIMTHDVITIGADGKVAEAANLLLKNKISAVPVVDGDGRVLGIVSEGDLMRRAEAGTERRGSWWLALVAEPEGMARDYVKSHSERVADVMTKPAIVVAEDASVAEIAELLEKKKIKRVPVVSDGKLAGIVSRANLLQALVAAKGRPGAAPNVDDAAIRQAVLSELKGREWASIVALNVVVADGVVSLWGDIESENQRTALRVAAENVAGVKTVEDHLAIMKPWMYG